jgi:hypothetical protein
MPTVALVAIWTCELTCVQAVTLVAPWGSSKKFARVAFVIRTMVDMCFVTALVFALPRYWLAAACALAFLVHFGLLAHFRHLQRPLSLLVLRYNFREGLESWPRSSPLQMSGATWLLLAALATKLVLVLIAPQSSLSWPVRLEIAGIAAIGLLAFLAAGSHLDPPSGIRGSRGFGRMGMIRGYFPTWLAEMHYCGRRDTLAHAIRQRDNVQDRLTPQETPIPIRDHIAIIQAESLDFNALGLIANGQEVTPYLNRLRRSALYYRLAGARFVGSADVDFTLLAGVMPSTRLINYKIPNFPYDNALPAYLSRYGFQTDMYHGNAGRFYDRRLAFARMGFRRLLFREELVHEPGVAADRWGIEDRHVLRLSSDQMASETGRRCHFIITMTTHTPYTYVNADECEIYPQPRSMGQHFLNNMRYLDHRLCEYIESLRAPTTVVIYGDHAADPALIGSPDFSPHWPGGREFIPCFIYDTATDLGQLQRTRDSAALDGSLTLLDLSGYLRAQVAATFGAAARTQQQAVLST